MRHLGVQAEAEDEEEDTRHHAGAAADKLEEVDASARRAHHDGLYADEADERQHLEGMGVGGLQVLVGLQTKRHFKEEGFNNSNPSLDASLCFLS